MNENPEVLFKEYLEVSARTAVVAQTVKPGGSYTTTHISLDDLALEESLFKALKGNHSKWLIENLNIADLYDFDKELFFKKINESKGH